MALYAGWLTAASGASLGIVLAGYGILSAQISAVLCLLGVAAIALAVQATRPREWAYPIGVIWALIAVIVANISPVNLVVVLLAALASALLAGRAILFATRS